VTFMQIIEYETERQAEILAAAYLRIDATIERR
jgi:hypothetical protein